MKKNNYLNQLLKKKTFLMACLVIILAVFSAVFIYENSDPELTREQLQLQTAMLNAGVAVQQAHMVILFLVQMQHIVHSRTA